MIIHVKYRRNVRVEVIMVTLNNAYKEEEFVVNIKGIK